MKLALHVATFLLTVAQTCAATIDVHLHAFSGKSWGKQITGAQIIEELNTAQIQKGVVISAGYFGGFRSLIFGRSYDKVRQENNYAAEIVRSYPDRLTGACGVHPFDDWAERELERCAHDLGFKAVKIHANAQRINLLDEKQRARLRSFVDRAGQLDMSVLVHAYGRSLDFNRQLYRLAVETPETTFVFLHAFGAHFIPLVQEINRGELEQAPNASVDISGTVLNLENSQAFVEALRKFGLDRVFFGSDFPVYTPKATLDALKRLPLSSEEIGRILSNNLRHSLRLTGKR